MAAVGSDRTTTAEARAPRAPTDHELRAHVRGYFSMLEGELRGRRPRGRRLARADEHRRDQREHTYRQIAALLIEEGLPFHSAYRPLASHAESVRAAVEAYLLNHPELLRLMEADVDAPVELVPDPRERGLDAIARRAPEAGEIPEVAADGTGRTTLSGCDFLAQEQRNRSLARAGELFVMRYEIERLRDADADACADAIEHVAAEQGTASGCDILSYDADGRERYIKVKTTRFRRETPFFVTANEIAMAALHREHFWLYRVFGFRGAPRLYTVNGPLNERFRLQPTAYRAVPR